MSNEKPFSAENPFRLLDKKQFRTIREKPGLKKTAAPPAHCRTDGEDNTAHSFYAEFGDSADENDTRAFLNAVSSVSRLGRSCSKRTKKKYGIKPDLENQALPPSLHVSDKEKPQKIHPHPSTLGISAEDEEDAREFAAAVRGVTPLAGKGREITPALQPASTHFAHKQNSMQDFMEGRLEFTLAFTKEYVEGHVVGMDLMLVGKLQAGRFSPEAYLDLHGMTTQQAFEALVSFFRAAYLKGYRTVLVVPGRGLNSPNGFSILREKVQNWFTQEPFRRVILAFCTARPADGGTGALYVLLRKFKKGKGKVYWDRRPADPDLV